MHIQKNAYWYLAIFGISIDLIIGAAGLVVGIVDPSARVLIGGSGARLVLIGFFAFSAYRGRSWGTLGLAILYGITAAAALVVVTVLLALRFERGDSAKGAWGAIAVSLFYMAIPFFIVRARVEARESNSS
jgi:hypothetical protein